MTTCRQNKCVMGVGGGIVRELQILLCAKIEYKIKIDIIDIFTCS